MNTNDYTIRLENAADYRKVENLVREAFWNVYRLGCSEYYVIYVLREDPAFIRELDFSLEESREIEFFLRWSSHNGCCEIKSTAHFPEL